MRWGETSGLIQAATEETANLFFDRQVKGNGLLVHAVLSAIEKILKELRDTELSSEKLTQAEAKQSTTDRPLGAESGMARKPGDLTDEVEVPNVTDLEEERRNLVHNKLSGVLQTQGAAKTQSHRKYPKGLNWMHAVVDGVVTVSKEPKRFKWVLRHAEKFRSGLDRVGGLIRSLEDMLSQEKTDYLIKCAVETKFELLHLSRTVEQLNALLEVEERQDKQRIRNLEGSTMIASTISEASGSISADEFRYTKFLQAAIRFSADIVEGKINTNGSLEMGRSDVDRLGIDSGDGGKERTILTASAEAPCWIEWKSFMPKALTREPDQETTERVRRLIGLLRATNKPVEFCIPPCGGYFVDGTQKRFGVVFERPTDSKPEAWPPKTLRESFAIEGVDLAYRISLAQQLSQWLMYMHAVNWLHKGIRSSNVFLFPRIGSDHLGSPYITGFEYSRKDSDGTITSPALRSPDLAWYVHPHYLDETEQSGFCKTYDMYSLAIVLIEIAFWQPIQEIYVDSVRNGNQAGASHGRDRNAGTRGKRFDLGEIGEMRGRMLDGEVNILKRLQIIAGPRYVDAVTVCLQGMAGLGLGRDLPQTDPSVAAHIQRAFVEKVLDQLHSIVL